MWTHLLHAQEAQGPRSLDTHGATAAGNVSCTLTVPFDEGLSSGGIPGIMNPDTSIGFRNELIARKAQHDQLYTTMLGGP